MPHNHSASIRPVSVPLPSLNLLAFLLVVLCGAVFAAPPQLGEQAPDFTLKNLAGKDVTLSTLTNKSPVALIVLRGFPGYQCPICSRQVGDLLAHADELAKTGASVLLVYPGPAERLDDRAVEFLRDRKLPDPFHFVLDPGYTFTNLYDLRWDAPRETAYPSTFILDTDRKVRFVKISRSHGGRSTAAEVLEALQPLKPKRRTTAPGNVEDVFARLRAHRFHPIVKGFTVDAKLGRHGIADMNDPGWRIRLLAVRDLVRLGESRLPAIRKGLTDANPHVRQVSAMVLGILNDADAADALVRVLEQDDDTVVRSQAAISLGRLCRQDTLVALQQASRNDPSGDVRHHTEMAAYRIEHGYKPVVELAAAYAALDESEFNRVQVGQPAPDFELKDTHGKAWRLSELIGGQPIALIWIFADWCPVCHHEFHDLIDMREAFAKRNVRVLTIECHDLFRSRVMVGEVDYRPKYWFARIGSPQDRYQGRIWWPHLIDPAGRVGATYGVQPLAFTVHSEWVNRPSTILIDKDGIVRFTYYGTYWGDRPSIAKTLQMIETGNYEYANRRRLKSE